jgi:hypothetical protein
MFIEAASVVAVVAFLCDRVRVSHGSEGREVDSTQGGTKSSVGFSTIFVSHVIDTIRRIKEGKKRYLLSL